MTLIRTKELCVILQALFVIRWPDALHGTMLCTHACAGSAILSNTCVAGKTVWKPAPKYKWAALKDQACTEDDCPKPDRFKSHSAASDRLAPQRVRVGSATQS